MSAVPGVSQRGRVAPKQTGRFRGNRYYARELMTEQLNGGTIAEGSSPGELVFTVPSGGAATDTDLADMVLVEHPAINVFGQQAEMLLVGDIILGLEGVLDVVSAPDSNIGVMVGIIDENSDGWAIVRENNGGTHRFAIKEITAGSVTQTGNGSADATSNGAWSSHNTTDEATPWQTWVIPFEDAGDADDDWQTRGGGLATLTHGIVMSGALRFFAAGYRISTDGGSATLKCGHGPGLVWSPAGGWEE